MNYEFEITYLACQSCTAKIHCERCGADLVERLLKKGGAATICIDIPKRHMTLQSDHWDEMDLLDAMEDIGLFAD